MRFTRLRLNGFKSFVDPTDLVIASGLTGVVGPNGCGKSNLLEALRWVMGENRPTAMRGGGMEDVIFAGAATRPARNFAEVAIHIDNSERLAPAGFNDSDQIEVTRRITRDAGSAYKANAKDVRARDVQMLFADASTGAHSPALVRQGQISELINAKPRARRRILEEAAGISGLYQRRHEAELKLKGTEGNLERVEDVLEQLSSQLSALARQARQAARYRDIGAALRQAEGVLLFRHWRDADEARLAAGQALTDRIRAASDRERDARGAAAARETADAALPPLREEEAIASAILQRLLVQRDGLDAEEKAARETIQTLEKRLEQLDRDMSREVALNQDAGETLARLTEEQGVLAAEDEGSDEAVLAAEGAAREAAEVLAEREAALAERTEDTARLVARHQSAERMAAEAEKARARGQAEMAKAEAAIAAAEVAAETAARETEAARTAEAEARAAAETAETRLAEADAALIQTQSAETEARTDLSAIEGEAKALKAEAAGLARLVERETGDGDQILDQITVAPGFENALGAALADDLRAPIVEGTGSGWAALPPYETPAPLPAGVEPLSSKVRAPGVLARRLGQIGVVAAAEGPALQAALGPGQRLVSTEGDLWRWDGYRAAAKDAPSAAALRLQQVNRLVELKADLEDVLARSEAARARHQALAEALAQARGADRAAREARRAADSALAEAGRRLSRAEAEHTRSAGKSETLTLALDRHREEAQAAETRLAEAEAARAKLGDVDALRAEVDDIKTTVEAARLTMLARRSAHDELRRSGAARRKRLDAIAKETASWKARLDTAETRSSELAERRVATEAELTTARQAPERVASARAELAGGMDTAETRRKAAADALAAGETALRDAVTAERDAERAASEAREARARAEAVSEAAVAALAQAEARIEEDLETTPEGLLETLDTSPENMPASDKIEAEVARLRRQRDALGAVNLRAEEDAKEVSAEHETLLTEKTDLEEAIRTLRSGINSLNREGRERMLAAFDQVNGNFSTLFTHLFGGGEANLVLVESDDPLEAGLEIMCQPPGKKLSTLSLLSGGEQTLTALALIFAVFLANPAPICVLDEVDAPLDDANVTRFCDLLDEMCRRTETRFLIITHHAITMGRMDRLFGVTMQEQGVSQLVSVDLKHAEAMVA